MQQTVKNLMIFLFIAALACTAACAKKQTLPTTPPVDESASGLSGLEEADLGSGDFKAIDPNDAELRAIFANIHFNYDQFSLTPQARSILNGIATWMKDNPRKLLLIEGHCDERGTNEYNLALGDRRANSAKTYLTQLGIEASRIYTLSYGEERPIDVGSTESAWAKNRRGEFKLQ